MTGVGSWATCSWATRRTLPHPGASGPGKPAAPGAAPGADPLAGGKLQRVEAYGHVVVRTPTEIVTGDRGVYLPDTGLAHIIGNVHITKGENQLNGAAAVVNMKTGLATLTQAPGGRVQGLVVPNGSGGAPGAAAASGHAAAHTAAKPAHSKKGSP